MLLELFLGNNTDHVHAVGPQGFDWVVVQFWNRFDNWLGYDTTVRIKDISVSVFTLLAGIIIGGFLVVRLYQNLVQSSKIDKLGTVKFEGNIISNPKSALETIDTLTAIIAIKFFPERVVQPRNMKRAKIIGRALWIIAILLIIFALVMSNFVMLDPYRDYMSRY